MYQWYRVIKLVNPHYAHEPSPPSIERLKVILDEAADKMMTESLKTFNDDVLLESDIARDDVAEIRATSCPHKGGNKDRELSDRSPLKLSIRYNCVTDSVQTSNNSHTDTTNEFLNQVANTFGVDVKNENQKYNESKSK